MNRELETVLDRAVENALAESGSMKRRKALSNGKRCHCPSAGSLRPTAPEIVLESPCERSNRLPQTPCP